MRRRTIGSIIGALGLTAILATAVRAGFVAEDPQARMREHAFEKLCSDMPTPANSNVDVRELFLFLEDEPVGEAAFRRMLDDADSDFRPAQRRARDTRSPVQIRGEWAGVRTAWLFPAPETKHACFVVELELDNEGKFSVFYQDF